MGEDEHLEMAYEDANGSAYLGEESEDVYAGTGANDDLDVEEEFCEECGEEMEDPDRCNNCDWDSSEGENRSV